MIAADVTERLRLAVGQSEPAIEHLGFTRFQRTEGTAQMVLQHAEVDRFLRDECVGVLDQVAKLGVVLITDRRGVFAEGLNGEREVARPVQPRDAVALTVQAHLEPKRHRRHLRGPNNQFSSGPL